MFQRQYFSSTSISPCIYSQWCPCGSTVWPTKDWSTQHFNPSKCHQLLDRREREGDKVWTEREKWHSVNASAPDCESIHTCTKTHMKPVSQSVNVHLRDWTSALSIPTDISTQSPEPYNSLLVVLHFIVAVQLWTRDLWDGEWWLWGVVWFDKHGDQVNWPLNLDQQALLR